MQARAGFSLIEVLLAATIFSFLSLAMSGALIYGRNSTANAGNYTVATQLADEGIQATTHVRNASYGNLVNGTYGLTQTSNTWNLSGASDTTDIFTRTITIADAGTDRKAITSTISWPQNGSTASISVMTRLTNWAANFKSWVNAVLSGSLDIAGTTDGIKVATSGNYAYVVQGAAAQGLRIVDISNAAAPTLVSSLTLAGVPTDITVSGNYAYVTTVADNNELQIVNISNPAAPSIVSSFNASGTADGKAVVVNGNYAYVARAASGGMVIVNISNPALPTLTGTYASTLTLNDIDYDNGVIFLATSSTTQEIIAVNVLVPAAPVLSTSLNLATTGTVASVEVKGPTLFIGHGGTLLVYNIATLLSPTLLGSLAISGATLINGTDIDASGKYLFLGTNSAAGELRIVDISTLSTPTLARTIDLTGSTQITGLAYNASLNTVPFTSASDTQECGVFIQN